MDERSEGNIATLLPEVRPHVRMLIQDLAKAGIIARASRLSADPRLPRRSINEIACFRSALETASLRHGVLGPKSQAREVVLSNLASRYPDLPWPPEAEDDREPLINGSQTVDPRSEGNIATLLPEVRNPVRKLIQEAAKAGIIARC